MAEKDSEEAPVPWRELDDEPVDLGDIPLDLEPKFESEDDVDLNPKDDLLKKYENLHPDYVADSLSDSQKEELIGQIDREMGDLRKMIDEIENHQSLSDWHIKKAMSLASERYKRLNKLRRGISFKQVTKKITKK